MSLKDEIMQHKYAVGGVALVGLFVLYLLLRSSSSGSSSVVGTVASADLQAQQLQNSAQLQAAQIGAAQQAAQLQAQAANNQVVAQAQVANNQTDAAALAAVLSEKQQSQANELSAQVQNTAATSEAAIQEAYINSQVAENNSNNATALSAYTNGNALQESLAQLQAELTSQGITASTQLATTQQADQYSLQQQAQSAINKAGLNHGTNSLEEQLAALEAEILGQPAVGVAAENANQAGTVSSNYAGASVLSSLLNSIGKIGTAAAGAL